MGRSDRDLVAALRAELAAIEPARACDRAAELAGLSGTREQRDPVVARVAFRLRRPSRQPVGGPGDAPERAPREGASEDRAPAPFDWDAAADHCRIAWLRGRFLATGSLSVAGGRVHLEFVVPPEEGPVLAGRVASIGLPASSRLRRGRGVVTWKGTDNVGTFLRLIGVGASLLELEARSVARALRGELNRVLNAESANLHRAVSAAGRHVAAIATLESDGRLAEQPHVVRLVADARRSTPEATLAELAERVGLHRSAVQRALDRIERLALHDDEGAGRRSAPTMRDRDGAARTGLSETVGAAPPGQRPLA